MLWTERFPEHPPGPLGHARALLAQGSIDQARALLLETCRGYPSATDARLELARLEEMHQNWIEAEQGWRELTAMRPAVWWAPASVALALREQGRIADAEAVLAEASDRFPDQAASLRQHAGVPPAEPP